MPKRPRRYDQRRPADADIVMLRHRLIAILHELERRYTFAADIPKKAPQRQSETPLQQAIRNADAHTQNRD